MENDKWTVGKGIGIAGKWIAIAIIVVSIIAFINDRFRDKDYYDRPAPVVPEMKYKVIEYCDFSCEYQTEEEQTACIVMYDDYRSNTPSC